MEVKVNKLVVGLQVCIFYVDVEGWVKIVVVFNEVIVIGEILVLVVLGCDYYDVSGIDFFYWEISNIYDGSKFMVDMVIYNVIGDSFWGVIWVFIYNGGGVGWGEVINGGFGMLLDGSVVVDCCLQQMLFYDVNNGIVCCSWVCNEGVLNVICCEMECIFDFKVIFLNLVDDYIIDNL